MEKFKINHDTCTQCGACADVCPAMVIQHSVSMGVGFVEDNQTLCLKCGQCMAVCPTKSIVANGLEYDTDFFNFETDSGFFSILEHRRSVRRFKQKPLSHSELENICRAMTFAPHGSCEHHVEVTVVNSRQKIMEAIPLMSAFYDQLGKWLHNPFMRHMIKSKVGPDGIKTLTHHLLPRIEKGVYRNYSFEYDGITRGAHTLMVFHAPHDAEEHREGSYIMVTIAALTAESMGIGATIIGLVPPAINKSKAVRRIFNIPDGHEAVVSLILGYPKYKFRRGIRRQLRKVHWIE